MSRIPTPGRIVAAIALAAAALVIAPSPASAHAGIESSSPANGAQLRSAPKAVTFTFEEKVTLAGNGTRIVDAQGKAVRAKATARGAKVAIVPVTPLAKGRYAASWSVRSEDGDVVTGAISFTVGQPNPKGSVVAIVAKPDVPTTLSAGMPGSRTLTMSTKAKAGDVEWTSSAVPGPILWEFDGNGTTGTATGVLPTAGRWSFEATLEMSNNAIVVVTGSVTLKG